MIWFMVSIPEYQELDSLQVPPGIPGTQIFFTFSELLTDEDLKKRRSELNKAYYQRNKEKISMTYSFFQFVFKNSLLF